jgi:hypothetical protein
MVAGQGMHLPTLFMQTHPASAHGQDRPDISRADFTWCMTASDWGWSVDDIATRLLEESEKARENGERYALRDG